MDKIKFQNDDEKIKFQKIHNIVQNEKSSPQYSYCWHCNLVKPERTHHCKMCEKCNLKMDHHCIWVGNCVGHFNHKFFIVFLFYAVIITITIFITSVIEIKDIINQKIEFNLVFFSFLRKYQRNI